MSEYPLASGRLQRGFARAFVPNILFLAALALPAESQEKSDTTRIVIYGTVVDKDSGTPIPDAFLRFIDTEFQIRGDTLGRFTLSGISKGSYYLLVEAPGYETRGGAIQVLRSGELTLPLDASPPEASNIANRLRRSSIHARSRIIGRVVEMETGSPVEGAEITLSEASGVQVTDARGRFEFDQVGAGMLHLSISFLGRAPVEDSVDLAGGATVELDIQLAVKPVEMDSMIILATPRNPYLEDMGFFRRREMGYNVRQISRELIEERAPRNLGDLLLSVPGVRVDFGGPGGFRVRMQRVVRLDASGDSGCVPAVFLDDVPVEVGWLMNIPPDRVDGIEVFSGVNAPIQYNDPCGVILVWTRRGEAGGGG